MLQTLAFPAGGRQIDAKATFFRYESCNASGADEAIRVRADGNDLGLFVPGDYVHVPAVATRWEVVPVTASATGTVRLGMGAVGSSRLTGNVRVIDSGAEKTMAGRQFISSVLANPDAVNQGVCNVQAGGGYFALRSLALSSTSTGDVMVAKASAPGTATPSSGSLLNKRLSGAGTALVRTGAGLAAPSSLLTAGEAPGCAGLMRLSLIANQVYQIRFDPPLILEGTGLVAVLGVAANRQLNAVFEGEDA